MELGFGAISETPLSAPPDFVVVDAGVSSTFALPGFKPIQLGRNQSHYFHKAQDETAPVETNIHFIGTFQPTKFRAPYFNRYLQDASDASTFQETNTHFIGTYHATTISKAATYLGWNPPQDETAPVETNVHEIPRQIKNLYASLRADVLGFYSETAQDETAPVETNPNFIGMFHTPKFPRLPYFGQTGDEAPVPETNPNFIGLYQRPKFKTPVGYLWHESITDEPLGPQEDTVTSFIGTYRPSRFSARLFTSDGVGYLITEVVFVVIASRFTEMQCTAARNTAMTINAERRTT